MNTTRQRKAKWRIVHRPAEPGRVVALSERRIVDNYIETAAFGTRKEAATFAAMRWGPRYDDPDAR